jgi:tetratricopeptide (TPR) repeat protein
MLPGLLEQLARTRDERALARAHMVAFWAHNVGAIPVTRAVEEARLAADHARNAGDEGLRSRALGTYVGTLRCGPQSARVIANELDAIEREESGPYLAACVELERGELELCEGRFDEARRFMQQAIDKFRDMGMPTMAGGCQMRVAETQLWEGDPAAALASLLPGDTVLAELGERGMRSTTQALLAQAHERLGHRDAACAAIQLSDELGAEADMWNYVITHGVRARIALAAGDHEPAEGWARSAVDRALATDITHLQAMAELELARVLSALGRPEEATTQARAALALYEAKGHRPGAGETRALLHELR